MKLVRRAPRWRVRRQAPRPRSSRSWTTKGPDSTVWRTRAPGRGAASRRPRRVHGRPRPPRPAPAPARARLRAGGAAPRPRRVRRDDRRPRRPDDAERDRRRSRRAARAPSPGTPPRRRPGTRSCGRRPGPRPTSPASATGWPRGCAVPDRVPARRRPSACWGAGPGLTPEGDDVLAGAAAAVRALGPAAGVAPERRDALVAALVPPRRRRRTGALSATLLGLAAAGAAPEPVHRLLAAHAPAGRGRRRWPTWPGSGPRPGARSRPGIALAARGLTTAGPRRSPRAG